MLLISILIYL